MIQEDLNNNTLNNTSDIAIKNLENKNIGNLKDAKESNRNSIQNSNKKSLERTNKHKNSINSINKNQQDVNNEIDKITKEYSLNRHKRINIEKNSSKTKKLTIDNFTIIKVIGTGSFGKVMLVSKEDDGKIYAMKILKKKNMILKDKILSTKNERKILEFLDHPLLLKLKYSFQNEIKLYLLTDYCAGGELYYHINKVGNFNEEAVKFYASQILLALEYLHSNKIFYKE